MVQEWLEAGGKDDLPPLSKRIHNLDYCHRYHRQHARHCRDTGAGHVQQFPPGVR